MLWKQTRSDIEPDIQDVPVLDQIILSFQMKATLFANRFFRTVSETVIVREAFRTNKPSGQVRMDGCGCIHGSVPLPDIPRSNLVGTDGEKTDVKCGYDVQILPVIGAGASLYSKAFLEAARKHAAGVLDALNRLDPVGEVPVVGIEPPEVYFLKHECMDLLPERRSEIEQHLNNVWLLDEFLLRSDEFNSLRIGILANAGHQNAGSQMDGTLLPRRVRFHPHCHQRAEGLSEDGLPAGAGATVELLHSCGFEVELLDTGCCGMAGTFGYEAEHYELSIKIGALKLFPMLRALEATNATLNTAVQKSQITSSGAACRMQIRQGTGVEVIHPILLVARSLMETEYGEK